MPRRHTLAPSRSARCVPGLLAGVLMLGVLGGCGTHTRAATPQPSASPTASVSAAPTPSPPTASPTRAPRPPRDTTSRATARQLVGLVRIVATLGSDGSGETSTGMVLTPDGQVVTNRHGVAGARSLLVTVMSTGRTYAARIVASDAHRDVALLRLVGAAGLTTVELAASDARVGDPITVVGDARGSATRFEAATGTVVALDQTVQTEQRGSTPAERLTGLLLNTADVVTGDSGGPTYDAIGRVVGMTTAAVATRSGPDGVAIPVGTLRAVIARLSAGG